MLHKKMPTKHNQYPSLDFLDTYRTALSIPDALNLLGIPVNGSRKILCPSHGESVPSCHVYEDHLYCYGCGFYKDVIGIVQHGLSCDFYEALEWIADQVGIPRPPRSPEAQERYECIQSVSDTYADVFSDSLKAPEPALAYLESRGISRETAKGIVGYLPTDYRPQNPETAQKAGLYSKQGGFLFAGRLVIPIRDRGRIVSLYGRALDNERIPKHVYPACIDPPMPTTLWNLDSCGKQKEVFLVEGIIDALTLMDKGFKNSVGLFGTNGLTDARIEALKQAHVEGVVLAFDSDANESGQKAALKAGEKLFRAGYVADIVTLPRNTDQTKCDPSSFFQDHTGDDFLNLPRQDFFQSLLDSIPVDSPAQSTFRSLEPVLRLVSEQPELLWKDYSATIHKRFRQFDVRKLEKQIARYAKEQHESDVSSDKFLPLNYVETIREEAPIISFDGKLYRYKGGVYSLTYNEEIDQKAIDLIGPEAQVWQIDGVRKTLEKVCFVRRETVNPRDLLNLKNGNLYVESGEFKPHSADILSTVQAEVLFDPEAICPLWLQTIEEILPDPELRLLLAQIFGYCLTFDNSWQKGFILFGEGANGKSVTTDVLEALVGRENCSALHLSDFKERFRLAELQNRLINFSTEVEAKGLVNDARLKGVITGDPILVERKNQDPFVFRPFVKLVVSCNNLPQTTDKTHGYFRRWIILPFSVTFPPEKWDRTRAKRIIETELSGVLNWAIGGYKALKDAGHFIEPSASKEALEEYKRQVEPVRDFIDECTKVFPNDPKGQTLKEVYAAYQGWAKENGYQPLGRKNFSEAVQRITRVKIKKDRNGWFFPGLFL